MGPRKDAVRSIRLRRVSDVYKERIHGRGLN